MSGYVDIPGDCEALAGHSLLLVVDDGGEAGRLLDGAEEMVLALGHEAAGLLQDALKHDENQSINCWREERKYDGIQSNVQLITWSRPRIQENYLEMI